MASIADTKTGKAFMVISRLVFYSVSVLFILISLLLIVIAFLRLWSTFIALPEIKLDALFEAIGFTTVSSAVFELARTMYDEEAAGEARLNMQRKIRNFLSRFFTVIIISLGIEFLTMVFRYSHKPDEFGFLFNAAAIGIGTAALLIAWAVYNKMSMPLELIEKGGTEKEA